ncbi:MAG: hypothetical protein HOO99_00430 [Hyphomicrobiaceae bacterium]|nr:hypothetical protein [Hyphomicrobiaceae bacterium]
MTMTAKIAATRIARELRTSETEIDRALASSAALLATMATASVETGEPTSSGQVAIMRLVKGLNSLTSARSDIVRVHAELLRVGEARADFAGGPSDCDPITKGSFEQLNVRIAS